MYTTRNKDGYKTVVCEDTSRKTTNQTKTCKKRTTARRPHQPTTVSLITAGIIENVRNDAEISRITKGKHQIIAYIDDIKCHAPSKEGIKKIKEKIKEAAKEIGLELNIEKCGIYTRKLVG